MIVQLCILSNKKWWILNNLIWFESINSLFLKSYKIIFCKLICNKHEGICNHSSGRTCRKTYPKSFQAMSRINSLRTIDYSTVRYLNTICYLKFVKQNFGVQSSGMLRLQLCLYYVLGVREQPTRQTCQTSSNELFVK